MAYKIAVASSDGKQIDLSFGAAEEFLIFEVNGTQIEPLRPRLCETLPGTACGNGGCGHGGHDQKVALLADCRCVLCRRIGPGARKELERKTISVFDLEAEVTETVQIVVSYFDKVDRHQNLR